MYLNLRNYCIIIWYTLRIYYIYKFIQNHKNGRKKYSPSKSNFTSDADRAASNSNPLSMFFDRSVASLSREALTAQPIFLREYRRFSKRNTQHTHTHTRHKIKYKIGITIVYLRLFSSSSNLLKQNNSGAGCWGAAYFKYILVYFAHYTPIKGTETNNIRHLLHTDFVIFAAFERVSQKAEIEKASPIQSKWI